MLDTIIFVNIYFYVDGDGDAKCNEKRIGPHTSLKCLKTSSRSSSFPSVNG